MLLLLKARNLPGLRNRSVPRRTLTGLAVFRDQRCPLIAGIQFRVKAHDCRDPVFGRG